MRNRVFFSIAMSLLAVYPILAYYISPVGGLTWGDITLWLGMASYFVSRKVPPGNKALFYPNGYVLFWIYAAIITIVTASSFKVSLLIPGGVHFFSWSLFLGYMLINRDLSTLRKAMRIVFVICAVVFAAQEVSILLTGYRFSALLPISQEVYGGLTLQELQQFQIISSRSCSFFMEPAYFAHYCLILLCLEIFDEKDNNVLFNRYAIIIGVVLLFIRSGSGILGLAVIALIKVIKYSRSSVTKFIVTAILIVPIAITLIHYYSDSSMGAALLARQSEFQEQDATSSGYVRAIRGFMIFDELPTINKIVGISMERILDSSLATLFDLDKNTLIANGIQTVLIRFGIIGFMLFLYVLSKLYQGNNILAKAAIIMFVTLSLIESTFLSPSMLLFFTCAYTPNTKDQLTSVKRT